MRRELLQELLTLSEGGFAAFYPEPYGNGLDSKPLKRGEEIMTHDDEHYSFVGVTSDGKKVIVSADGKNVEMSPKNFDIEIHPVGTKIVKGKAVYEAGRTFTIKNPNIKPRGAPEDKARAFDKVNPKTGARPNRSVLKKMQKDTEDFFAIQGEEGDKFTMCLVMSAANSEKSNYYGVNVLLYPDGKTDASTADSFADKEWKNHRGRIVKVAREFLKKANAFSRDIDGPSDYHGYHDKKTNESVEEKKSVKAKKTPRPTFKFTACSYEQFERLCPDSESYDETEIDGKSVMAAYDGKNCIGMWYRRAKVGSFCKEFVGDELSYSEEDPNWPYGD